MKIIVSCSPKETYKPLVLCAMQQTLREMPLIDSQNSNNQNILKQGHTQNAT